MHIALVVDLIIKIPSNMYMQYTCSHLRSSPGKPWQRSMRYALAVSLAVLPVLSF
jgi:hypothetical protein